MPTRSTALAPAAALALGLAGCMSLDYDLASVPVPVSAKPAADGADATRFHVHARQSLWFHGLFGRSQPDVAALLAERARGSEGVASFRVTQRSGLHEWLLAHLSLTLYRSRTVTIEGELVGAPDA